MDARNLIVGALVADAAALGTHWIYDKTRIAEVGEPFREPDVHDYRDRAGYFAAKGKRAGDMSHYGKQLMVALESLAATGGVADPDDYEKRYVKAFGPGGSWVGYIDYATRETLWNIDSSTRRAVEAAKSVDLGEFEKDRAVFTSKVFANRRGPGLEKAVRITHDDDRMVELADRMAEVVEAARGGFRGSDDFQLPGLACVPVAVAFGADIEPLVRVTHNTDRAVEAALEVAALLRGEIEPSALAGTGGPACPLDQAIPTSARVLTNATSYEEGIKANILEGGDNCGRAFIVGAWLGARHEIPEKWVEKTAAMKEAEPLLSKLL